MRKYYSLTAAGKDSLTEFKNTWKRIENIVTKIMESVKNDKKK